MSKFHFFWLGYEAKAIQYSFESSFQEGIRLVIHRAKDSWVNDME
jgi:hypothetical protein